MPSAIPILMYHNVDRPRSGAKLRGLYVLPRMFRLQMRMLKLMGYRGLSMSDLLPYLRGEQSGKVVGITFDDGYLDNLTYALPVLRRLGFGATCYLVNNCIGADNRWDQAKGIDAKPLMDREQIRQWLAAGMEIGAHTLDHADLSRCGADQLQAQIRDARQQLEALFQVPVEHFCYPYGAYNDEVVEQVRAAGYQTATTTRRSRATPGDPLLELPRVPVYRSTLPHLFWAKIATAYEDRRG